MPPVFTLDDPPADQTVESPWGEFSRKIKVGDDGRTVSVEFDTRLDKAARRAGRLREVPQVP